MSRKTRIAALVGMSLGLLGIMLLVGVANNAGAAPGATATAKPTVGTAATVTPTVDPRVVRAIPTNNIGPSVAPNTYKNFPDGRPAGIPTPGPKSTIKGGEAILPSNKTADASTPGFTTQEATAWALTHRVGYVIDNIGSYTVKEVAFLTGKELDAKLNDHSGIEADRLVCYVALSGQFSEHGSKDYDTKAYEVFDAQTGNLLVAGSHK